MNDNRVWHSFDSHEVCVRVFDKRFLNSTHVYGVYRVKDTPLENEVVANHQRVRDALGYSKLVVLQQVHGTTVIDANAVQAWEKEYEGDASTTAQQGVVLGILTADCVPVFLCSPDKSVIGAAHCGWRSTHGNILEELAQRLKQQGAKTLYAWIGPCIHQASYEVDESFRQHILSQQADAHSLFKTGNDPQHYLFDLPGFVTLKLHRLGIDNVISCAENTYTQSDRYPSYRRHIHEGMPNKKENILSTVWMRSLLNP